MGRKSRKNAQLGIVEEKEDLEYSVAMYARLSVEDNGVNGSSIENQVYLMKNYVEQQKKFNFNVYDTFVDNGYTGTDFQRPAFQDMMLRVKEGEINCIVVKDLSRFGRNYIEVGEYLERIFPCLGIRFIAINDNFDSNSIQKNDGLLVSLKSIIHDAYTKDISKKVSSSMNIKKKSGKFMGKIPPYGYIRSETNRYKLEVHREHGEVIKQIYTWFLGGLGVTAIARKLNDRGIAPQMKLRFLEGCSDGREDSLWHGSSVGEILKNHYYLVWTVVRKSENLLYKNRNAFTVPRQEWEFVKDTHESLVDEETFQRVQTMFLQSKEKWRLAREKHHYREGKENIVCGLLICGDCGGRLQRDTGYYKEDGTLVGHSFLCHKKYLKEGGCSFEGIKEDVLLEILSEICRKQMKLWVPTSKNHKEWGEKVSCCCEFQELTTEICQTLIEKIIIKEDRLQVYYKFSLEFSLNGGGKENA